MNKYSELIGSFIRTGNFPLEAHYIFPTEQELIKFYKDPINKITLHRGLFKIVLDDGNGKQALYWVVKKETNDDLKFVKLISFSDVPELNSSINDLYNKLEQEITERKEEDTVIYGTDNRLQIPDDLNSILDLSSAILELRRGLQEEIERANSVEESLKEDIRYIVGTEEEDIRRYVETNLDYKSLTDISNELNRFLNTVDSTNTSINTFLELQSFLSGYNDTEKLKDILQKLVDDIMGDPTPNTQFRTLRGIQDFIEELASFSKNRTDNLQKEIDQTQIGVGLSGDGSFNSDKETYYLKDATSVMNSLKILDSLINEAINNCHLESENTETVETKIDKYKERTVVSANVLVSTQEGNGIIVRPDGLYHKVESHYQNGVLTLYVNDNIVAQHVLGLSYIGIHSAFYDPTTESLVFQFLKENGQTDELRVPVSVLIREWVIDNSGVNDVVILNRIEQIGNGPDKLSADVRLFADKYNILQKQGNTLYVKGTADNIVWNDVKVSVLLDDLKVDQNKLRDLITSESNKIISITNRLQEKLDEEILRATEAETKLRIEVLKNQEAIDIKMTSIENQVNTNAKGITTLTSEINDEINRATKSENTLESRITQEILRATSKENELAGKISNNETDISNVIQDLTNEVNRASKKEQSIQDQFTKEVNDLKVKDNELTGLISLEEERAKNSESILDQKILVATSQSIKAVDISEKASDKVNDLQNTISEVNNKVDNETTRAKAQELILKHSIEDLQDKVGNIEDIQQIQIDMVNLKNEVNDALSWNEV